MDGQTWKVAGITALVMLVLLALGGLAFMYSGAYTVAATEGHTGLMQWVLETTKSQSIRTRGIEAPHPPIFDSALVVSGFDGFRDMCVECHGAPVDLRDLS